MPFIWAEVYDEPPKNTTRGYIERSVTVMLSNRGNGEGGPVDPAEVLRWRRKAREAGYGQK